MRYDELVESLGQFGSYQRRIFFLASLPCFTAAILTIIPVFILQVPEHRCAIPGYKNDTYQIQNEYHQSLINYTLPRTPNNDDGEEEDGMSKWGDAQCNIYRDRTFPPNMSHGHSNQTIKCHKWVYDTSQLDSSFVTDDDMVCDRKVYRDHANMVFMCGQLVGSMFFGFISDKFGRKTSLMGAMIIQTASSVATAFANSFAVFAALRFLVGTSCAGLMTVSFVIAVELLGPKYRAQLGIINQFFWISGMFVLDAVAFFVRDWRNLELYLSCYTVLTWLLYCCIPESARWQISQGKVKEARVTLEKVAKSHGKTLPKDAFDDVEAEKQEGESTNGGQKITDLFTSRVLLLRLIVVYINWVVVTMVYYGLTLNVQSLGGSIYVNFAFNVGTEVLADVATLIALPTLGRKRFHCFCMLLGGTACLASMIPSLIDVKVEQWVSIFLSNVGKFGATGAFNLVYVYTVELFPTYMRSSVLGSSSMVARLGGIAAPYVADLGILVGGDFGTSLPFVVFGGASVFAGLLALTLPETLNMGTPENIEDAIYLGKRKKPTMEKPVLVPITPKVPSINGDIGHINLGYDK